MSSTAYDPFERESPLAADDRAALEAYVVDVAKTLGLSDWHIRISAGLPDDADHLAETAIRGDSDDAVLAFADRFFAEDRPELDRRTTIIHELLHCRFTDLQQFVLEAIEGELGSAGERLFRLTYKKLEERTIDRLAMAIAPMLPPSPEPA